MSPPEARSHTPSLASVRMRSAPLVNTRQFTSGRAVMYGAWRLYGKKESRGVLRYASPSARVTARDPATRLIPPLEAEDIAFGALLHLRKTAVTSAGLYAE